MFVTFIPGYTVSHPWNYNTKHSSRADYIYMEKPTGISALLINHHGGQNIRKAFNRLSNLTELRVFQ
jgi:hypothetical protein